MDLQPHQQRVVTELDELNEKREKLAAFFNTETYNGLPAVERTLLMAQSTIMQSYASILGQRIAGFTQGQ